MQPAYVPDAPEELASPHVNVDSSLPVNDSIAVVEPVSVGGPERIVTTGGVVSAGGDGEGGGVVGGGVGAGAPPPPPPPHGGITVSVAR